MHSPSALSQGLPVYSVQLKSAPHHGPLDQRALAGPSANNLVFPSSATPKSGSPNCSSKDRLQSLLATKHSF